MDDSRQSQHHVRISVAAYTVVRRTRLGERLLRLAVVDHIEWAAERNRADVIEVLLSLFKVIHSEAEVMPPVGPGNVVGKLQAGGLILEYLVEPGRVVTVDIQGQYPFVAPGTSILKYLVERVGIAIEGRELRGRHGNILAIPKSESE